MQLLAFGSRAQQCFRYLNNTGLMWESAQEFGALLLFAEHRYYGPSKPYSGQELKDNMQYLTAEQAMADYAELLTDLKAELHAEESPVIGFGGSYGGMLAAWMRMKYPHILDGAIAASAPIWYSVSPLQLFAYALLRPQLCLCARHIAWSAVLLLSWMILCQYHLLCDPQC